MKRYVFVIVILALFISSFSVSAQNFYINGSAEEVFQNIELSAKMMNVFMNTEKCYTGELNQNEMFYGCDVDASNRIEVYTDKNNIAHAILLMAKPYDKDGLRDSTIDWIFLTTAATSKEAYYDDIMEVALKVVGEGLYEDKYIKVSSITDEGYFIYLLKNK